MVVGAQCLGWGTLGTKYGRRKGACSVVQWSWVGSGRESAEMAGVEVGGGDVVGAMPQAGTSVVQ